MVVVSGLQTEAHLQVRSGAPRPLSIGPPATTPNLCGCQDHNATADVGGGDGSSKAGTNGGDKAGTNDGIDETSAMWVGGNALLPIHVEHRV